MSSGLNFFPLVSSFSACPTSSNGGELFASLSFRQPSRLERRIHEGTKKLPRF